MNFERMEDVCRRMSKERIIDKNTKVIANHFSHNGLVSYDEAKEIGNTIGYTISYDGMELII